MDDADVAARVWRELNAAPLDAAGLTEQVACAPHELARFHVPLGRMLIERCLGGAGRCLVAVGGVPAGGKTVFTALMARVVRALEPPFGVAAVGLDGYHYPNAYLDATPAPGGDGPLRLWKGAHFTFDALRLATDLRRLREGVSPLALPTYDRRRHEPAEGAIRVGPADRLVLVEGNYLLYRQGDWAEVFPLFHLRIFLALPPGVNRERLVARHMRGGRSREEAIAHLERTDWPNTLLVSATAGEADVVVSLDDQYRVAHVACASGPWGL